MLIYNKITLPKKENFKKKSPNLALKLFVKQTFSVKKFCVKNFRIKKTFRVKNFCVKKFSVKNNLC